MMPEYPSMVDAGLSPGQHTRPDSPQYGDRFDNDFASDRLEAPDERRRKDADRNKKKPKDPGFYSSESSFDQHDEFAPQPRVRPDSIRQQQRDTHVPEVMVTNMAQEDRRRSRSEPKKKRTNFVDDFIERVPKGPSFVINSGNAYGKQVQPRFGGAAYLPGGFPRLPDDESVDDVMAMDLNGPVVTLGRTSPDGKRKAKISAAARERQAMIARGEALARQKVAESESRSPSPRPAQRGSGRDRSMSLNRRSSLSSDTSSSSEIITRTLVPGREGSDNRSSLKSEITVDDLKKPSLSALSKSSKSSDSNSSSDSSRGFSRLPTIDQVVSKAPGRFGMSPSQTPSPGTSPIATISVPGKPPVPKSPGLAPAKASPRRDESEDPHLAVPSGKKETPLQNLHEKSDDEAPLPMPAVTKSKSNVSAASHSRSLTVRFHFYVMIQFAFKLFEVISHHCVLLLACRTALVFQTWFVNHFTGSKSVDDRRKRS
jgi:hypothetical protein